MTDKLWCRCPKLARWLTSNPQGPALPSISVVYGDPTPTLMLLPLIWPLIPGAHDE